MECSGDRLMNDLRFTTLPGRQFFKGLLLEYDQAGCHFQRCCGFLVKADVTVDVGTGQSQYGWPDWMARPVCMQGIMAFTRMEGDEEVAVLAFPLRPD